MGTDSLSIIKQLVKELPVKDVPHAERFIAKRDFESLRDLVDSAIKRIEISLASDKPKEEYANIDTGLLESLLSEIIIYLSYLDISEFDNDEDGDFYESMCDLCEEW